MRLSGEAPAMTRMHARQLGSTSHNAAQGRKQGLGPRFTARVWVQPAALVVLPGE